jgi:hypothetical protein
MLLIGITFGKCELKAHEAFEIEEVPLSVTHVDVKWESVLQAGIRRAVSTPGFAVFTDGRDAWIKRSGRDLVPLAEEYELPKGFDYYGRLGVAGEKVVASVGWYPEERLDSDKAAPGGGYRAGPDPMGLLVISPSNAEYVPYVEVTSAAYVPDSTDKSPVPDTLLPSFQSCFWTGSRLLIGAYGYLASIDLFAKTAELIDFDGMSEINRMAIFKDGDAYWVSCHEGGAVGAWITKLAGSRFDRFCLLEFCNGDLYPDTYLRYKGKLLTSSMAGIVEIDEKNKKYVHYQLSDNRWYMASYDARIIDGELWAEKEDGLVRFDLDENAATIYHLAELDQDQYMYAAVYFDDAWYLAVSDELVVIKSKPSR